MKNATAPILLFFSVFFLLTAGCSKWRDNRETKTSSDHTLAEATFNAFLGPLFLKTVSPGVVTDSCMNTIPNGTNSIILDFDTTPCLEIFSTDLRGRIDITFSATFTDPGAEAVLTPQNLFVDNYKVEGTMTVTNLGTDSSGKQLYSVKVENGNITLIGNLDGTLISWECDYRYRLIEKNSVLVNDDLFEVTGEASGFNQEGRPYTAEITETLRKNVDCRWMRSGKVKIRPEGLDDREINYGLAECDQLADCCDNIATVGNANLLME